MKSAFPVIGCSFGFDCLYSIHAEQHRTSRPTRGYRRLLAAGASYVTAADDDDRAAEGIARARRFNAVKIAVMTGNARAQEFYEANGYSPGELVLYRRLGDQ